MSERVVAEFFSRQMTGQQVLEQYAIQEGRLIDLDSLRHGDGTFRFNDGIKTYKPVMMKTGWKIVCVKETE